MFCSKCGNEIPENSKFCANCGQSVDPAEQQPSDATVSSNPNQTLFNTPTANTQPRNRIVAGLLGIFLGGLGIHNFYLGFTNKALIQLLVCLVGGTVTCGLAAVAMVIWGIVEGVQILTGSINTDAQGVPLQD